MGFKIMVEPLPQPGLDRESKEDSEVSGFGWDRVNFPPSSCHVSDLVREEY